ncbi:protein of unknown function [Kyrpidia spormannii]|uniref:Uncharacterized protein n=2 Tax=Kyrpidia spormannii TaxID=2055160 RepID=A0ACA8Z6P3_9BACL|nr:protein of unknown function [Kyrpidia spormannii]CAB3390316.1 protein of unknown function [Kyrpidia spormannii]
MARAGESSGGTCGRLASELHVKRALTMRFPLREAERRRVARAEMHGKRHFGWPNRPCPSGGSPVLRQLCAGCQHHPAVWKRCGAGRRR